PKKRQRLVKILSVFLVFAIILGTALGIFINNKFNMMGDPEQYTDVIYEEEQFSDIDGDINASNFKDALKNWATTGNDQKMSSKNVVNVLLIGADSRQGTNTGNTDVMMLVSLNKKTKQIKLVSFMRDSYLYIEGKNNSYCSKLNAAFSMGGPEVLLNTIENNYKIEIDDFVMVNFESFKSIIEAMGGITVDVQKYEANYANNRYKLSMPYGDDVTLNGEEALAFCRIRGCDADGDVSRTRRQRQVINAMINRVTNASVSDLNKYLNALLPYVYTGFSKSEILSLGMKAITNGWAFYERSELQIPTPETRTSGSMGSWVWVIDYQLAAQTLQNELYGESNIVLEEGRTTLIDIYNGTSGSGSSDGGSSSAIEDDNSSNNEITVPETTEGNTVEFIDGEAEEDFEEDMGSPDIPDETEEITEEFPEETEPEFEEIPEETEENITSAPENIEVVIGE
ncbi:MAG: LCP family protein, partial [Clostridia bacterium]|nr:LCP family protein [Clostridia bacterium]